jgi:hypothetical protein
MASGCISKCGSCKRIISQRCLLGRGYTCATYDEYLKFRNFHDSVTGGKFAPEYVYALPNHAGKFYRKRRARYEQVIVDSAIVDLAATITRYL